MLTASILHLLEPSPDPYESFPRTSWRSTIFGTPPYRPLFDDDIQVAGAARNASEAWSALRGAVDPNGFVLAVTDKALEL